MKAGRELDALVAEKVFAWEKITIKRMYAEEYHLIAPGKPKEPHTVCEYITGNLVAPCLPNYFIPHYSTNIAAAWEVVEKLKLEGRDFLLHWKSAWECIFWFGRDKWFESRAQTAPEAICLAALKVKRD